MIDSMDVVIGETRYKISRMDSGLGSWLLMKLLNSLRGIIQDTEETAPKIFATPEEEKEFKANGVRALIQNFLETMDQSMFQNVQNSALSIVTEYIAIGTVETNLPILNNGRFAKSALKSDISAVLKLTNESLFFNLSPFFLGNESSA